MRRKAEGLKGSRRQSQFIPPSVPVARAIVWLGTRAEKQAEAELPADPKRRSPRPQFVQFPGFKNRARASDKPLP